MGSKNRYLIIILFFFNAAVNAQEKLDYRSIDSLTYSYYTKGEWKKLISLAQSALVNNIDFKYLRQRTGYAFFALEDYYSAAYHFEKALTFDSYDQFTLKYLYYSYLYSGKEEFTGIFSNRLDPQLIKELSVRQFKAFESIDFEYNYKYAGAISRSDPQYYRLGVKTKLGYKFSLYQSFSGYHQVIMIQQNGKIEENKFKEPEYYALMSYNVSNQFMVKTAYHFIQTTSGTTVTNGNFLLLAAAKDLNRLSVEVNGSVLKIAQDFTYQAGVHTSYTFPGRSYFYLNGTLSWMFQQNSNRIIYNQKAGMKVMKKLWLEGNVAFGRMTGYNDYNGLYVYNSYDPMTFRGGAAILFLLNRKITLWVNSSYESKEYLENSSFHYNQFSYLGGIKWKL